jgi:hypothetical protein
VTRNPNLDGNRGANARISIAEGRVNCANAKAADLLPSLPSYRRPALRPCGASRPS